MATMMEKKPVPIRLDERGRICLPSSLRKALDLEPGDTLFAQAREGRLEFAKAESPFEDEPTPEEVEALDGLARHAIKEYEAGRTRPLREFAKEQGFQVDGE